MREPEPEVVRRARAGDLEAFEELVRAHQADGYRLAIQLVRDRETAEDVTQEAFVRAFRSLPRFRGTAKFSTWLYRIARNSAVDAIRRRERQRRLERATTEDVPVADPSLRAAVHAAIDRLPPELHDAFSLIEVFGLSYREASTVLGVLPGTLKSRMHRARQLLMVSLAEEDTGEV